MPPVPPPRAAHDAGMAAIVVRVRHAVAVAEFVHQGREVEAARLQPFLGPAVVAGVELGLAFVVLVGRAHPAEQRGAGARRAIVGDDLEVGLGAVVDLDEDQVGDLLVMLEAR